MVLGRLRARKDDFFSFPVTRSMATPNGSWSKVSHVSVLIILFVNVSIDSPKSSPVQSRIGCPYLFLSFIKILCLILTKPLLTTEPTIKGTRGGGRFDYAKF